MKNSPKLSYGDYRTACNEAFSANMHNPTVYYNPSDGFYVAPSSDLVPNTDTVISLAYYSANSGERSLTGSRREYTPIARAIREFFAPEFNPIRVYNTPSTLYCEGVVDGHDCGEMNYGDKCSRCGRQNTMITVREKITLKNLIEEQGHA